MLTADTAELEAVKRRRASVGDELNAAESAIDGVAALADGGDFEAIAQCAALSSKIASLKWHLSDLDLVIAASERSGVFVGRRQLEGGE